MEMETTAVRFHVKVLFDIALNVRLQTSFPAVHHSDYIRVQGV